MTMTKYEFEDKIDAYAKIDLELRFIADQYANKFEGGGFVEGIEVDYDGVFGTVEVTGSIPSHCGCCSDDYMSFTFPLRYLYEADWMEQEQAIRDEEQRKRDEAKREKEAEKAKLAAETERKLYDELKAKYD